MCARNRGLHTIVRLLCSRSLITHFLFKSSIDLRRKLRISTPESKVLVSVRSEELGAILKPVPADKEKCPKSECGYKRERAGTPWVVCTKCDQWYHCRCVVLSKAKADQLPEWCCKNCT